MKGLIKLIHTATRIILFTASAFPLIASGLEEGAAQQFALPVTFGAYVDTYYAYDSNNPARHDRYYTTAAVRSNEFNVNLAYLEGKVNADRVRGRVAIQMGTSVTANYLTEPTLGNVSGSSVSRHLQEGYAGYRIADGVWIDAGIMFSYIGLESWISRDNWTYTRSLSADYTPYFQSGIRVTDQITDAFSVQLNVVNGWINISEDNANKGVGLQLKYSPSRTYSLTYNNFVGNVTANQPRIFNEIFAKFYVTPALQLAGLFDYGLQKNSAGDLFQSWHAFTILGTYQCSARLSLGFRMEDYLDPHQIVVTTNTPNGFLTAGGSVNVDYLLYTNLLWRNELRWLWSKDEVFPGNPAPSSNDGVIVSSLTLSM